jgi:putative tryptophan/tyrosine transport system substrate-binding protein
MRRREFIGLVGGTAVWPLAVRAQQSGRVPVVGVLWAYANAEAAAANRLSLLEGLADLRYIPGKTFILEERYANGVPERLDSLANELIALKVDVLVSQAGGPTIALHRATSTIPIFFVGVDPALQGWTSSLSKPGGNMSGISQMSADTSAKRLQLLQKTIPTVSHVALLRDPTSTGAPYELSRLSDAAKELGLSYEVFDASTGNDIDQAFQRMEGQNLQAVVAFSANLFSSESKRIAALGLKHRLAVMGPSKYFVEAGSLLSYGVDFPTLWYGSARFVDKILRGESVGDIPVQQPKFYFCLNLRTAKALDIEITPAMLALADEVIE